MQRTLALNLFLAFVVWSTFKAGESLLRTAGSQDIYAFYNLVWLYYAIIAFSALGGLALAYAILKAKPWGYLLGQVWLAVGVLHIVFTGLASYINKSLMIEIMTKTFEARGRDTSTVADFVNSPAAAMSILGGAVIMVLIMLFFMWQLHKKRTYFERV